MNQRFKQLYLLLTLIGQALLFPFLLAVFTPVEWGLWKAYIQEGYLVPNYVKFVWVRIYGTLDDIEFPRISNEPQTRVFFSRKDRKMVGFRKNEFLNMGDVEYIRKDIALEFVGKLNQKIWDDMQRIREERERAKKLASYWENQALLRQMENDGLKGKVTTYQVTNPK